MAVAVAQGLAAAVTVPTMIGILAVVAVAMTAAVVVVAGATVWTRKILIQRGKKTPPLWYDPRCGFRRKPVV